MDDDVMEQRRPGDPVGIAYESRLGRSARLVRVAWRLVRTDRTMLALGAAGAAFGVVAAVVLAGAAGYLDGHPSRGRLVLAVLVGAWPLTFVSVFLNVALAAAADAALTGRPRLTVGQALAVSRSKAGQIALWSLLAAGVGQLLQQVAAKLPVGARLAAWVLGGAWTILTVFVVPVLAIEGCTAPQCLRRSSGLIRGRWGEGIAGTVVISAVFTAAMIVPALVLGSGLAFTDTAAGLALVVAAGAAILVLFAAFTATHGVFAVALYRYAADGAVTGGFPRADLEAPFTKRRRPLFGGRDHG